MHVPKSAPQRQVVIDEATKFHSNLEWQQRVQKAKRNAPQIYRAGEAPAWLDEDEDDLISQVRGQDQSIPIRSGEKPTSTANIDVVVATASVPSLTLPSHLQHTTSSSSFLGQHEDQHVADGPVPIVVMVDASEVAESSSFSSSHQGEGKDGSEQGLSRRELLRRKMLAKDADISMAVTSKDGSATMQDVHNGGPVSSSVSAISSGAGSVPRGVSQEIRVSARAAAKSAEESSEESETDSEAEREFERRQRELVRPVYVARKDRITQQKQQEKERAEEEASLQLAAQNEQRVQESKRLVEEQIARELAMEQVKRMGGAAFAEVPDDEDREADFEVEELAWQVRELMRLKRDKEERQKAEEEAAEQERRRNMTPEERAREDALATEAARAKAALTESENHKNAKSQRFMQRYHHKGAFFQADEFNEDGLFDRDFQEATGWEAVVDISKLPKTLQVKGVGMKGRTKYTHLAAQDTTQSKDNLWVQGLRDARRRRDEMGREGGHEGGRDRGSRSKSRSRSRSRSRGRGSYRSRSRSNNR